MTVVTKSGKIALSMVQAGDSQNFWMLPNDYGSIPAGLYITKQSIDSFKTNPSDSNIFMNSSNGIFIRNGLYNQIALQAGATNPSLRLYAPGGTGSEGELSVELTGGTNPVLNLYKIQGTTHTIAATLNTQGLTLKDGGIRGGDPNTSGFIYLSTNDYTSQGTPASGVSMTFQNYDSPFPLTTNTNGEATVSFDDFAIQHESYYNGNVTIGNDSFSDINFADEVFDLDRNSPTSTYVTDNGQYSIYASYNSSTAEIIFHITAISTITINGNSSNWRLIAGTQFGVTNAGALYASNVNVSGYIAADTGRIGGANGWTITSQQIFNDALGSNGSMYLATQNIDVGQNPPTIGGHTITNAQTETEGWRLTVGSGFGVTDKGTLYANGVEISGKFSATSLSTNGRDSRFDGQPGVYMDATGIYLGGSGTAPNGTNAFYVLADGALHGTSISIINNTLGANNGVYLGTSDLASDVTIGSHTARDWRLLIGNQFGVDKSGKIYASGAVLSGYAGSDAYNYAENYITLDGSGIKIGKLNSNTYAYNHIDADGMKIYKGTSSSNSVCIANFGETITLGQTNDCATIAANSFNIKAGGVNSFSLRSESLGTLVQNYDKVVSVSNGNSLSYSVTTDFPINNIVDVGLEIEHSTSYDTWWGLEYITTSNTSIPGGYGRYSRSGNNITITLTANSNDEINIMATRITYQVSTSYYLTKMTLGSFPYITDTDNFVLAVGNGYSQGTSSNAMTLSITGDMYVKRSINFGTDVSDNKRLLRPIFIGQYPPSDYYTGKEGDIYIQY